MNAIVRDLGGRLHGNAPCIALDDAPMMDLSAAEAVLLNPKSGREDLMNAAHAFSFSPDPDHRAYGREVLAALWDMGSAELVTEAAKKARGRIQRAEQRFDDAVSRRRAELAAHEDRRSSAPVAAVVVLLSCFSICALAYLIADVFFL